MLYLLLILWVFYCNNLSTHCIYASHRSAYPSCVHCSTSLQSSLKTRHSCHESSAVTFLKIDTTSGTGPKNVIDTSSNYNQQRHRHLLQLQPITSSTPPPTTTNNVIDTSSNYNQQRHRHLLQLQPTTSSTPPPTTTNNVIDTSSNYNQQRRVISDTRCVMYELSTSKYCILPVSLVTVEMYST